MGICSNAFFSETTNTIKAKLYMNVHWMVLYNLKVFCSDMKYKMAATAGLNLTLDPLGKMFQNASSLKPLGQLKPNCPGMIIGWSSTNFMFLCRSEMQDGRHRNTYINIGPYGENVSKCFFSATTWTIDTKLPRNDHWKVLYKLYVFLRRSEIQDGRHRNT